MVRPAVDATEPVAHPTPVHQPAPSASPTDPTATAYPAYPPPAPAPAPPAAPAGSYAAPAGSYAALATPYAAPVPYAAPHGHAMASPPPRGHRPVAATFVLAGTLLFAWYVAGAAANLGTDVFKPAVFVDLAGVRVFAPAAVVCLVLFLWLRRARSAAAGVVVTLVGLGLVTYAVWQGYKDWRFLIGSTYLAGAVFVLLGGLGGLRSKR